MLVQCTIFSMAKKTIACVIVNAVEADSVLSQIIFLPSNDYRVNFLQLMTNATNSKLKEEH